MRARLTSKLKDQPVIEGDSSLLFAMFDGVNRLLNMRLNDRSLSRSGSLEQVFLWVRIYLDAVPFDVPIRSSNVRCDKLAAPHKGHPCKYVIRALPWPRVCYTRSMRYDGMVTTPALRV